MPADFNLGTRDVPILAVGRIESASTVFTVPSNIGVGSYYLLAKADVAGAVTESNENEQREDRVRSWPSDQIS